MANLQQGNMIRPVRFRKEIPDQKPIFIFLRFGKAETRQLNGVTCLKILKLEYFSFYQHSEFINGTAAAHDVRVRTWIAETQVDLDSHGR